MEDEHWIDTDDDYADLRSDEKAAEFCRRFESPEAGLKAYHDYHKSHVNQIHVPQDLSTLDDSKRSELMTKVGRVMGAPESPEGYELARPELPEGLAYDEDGEKALRDWASKHNIPQSAAKDLYDLHNQNQVKYHEANVQAINQEAETYENERTNAVGELQKEYGDQFDDTMTLVQNFLGERAKKIGLTEQDIQDALRATKVGLTEDEMKDPKIVKKLGNTVPLVRLLVDLAKDFHAEGQTSLGQGAAGAGGGVNASQRWPTSTAQGVMTK